MENSQWLLEGTDKLKDSEHEICKGVDSDPAACAILFNCGASADVSRDRQKKDSEELERIIGASLY